MRTRRVAVVIAALATLAAGLAAACASNRTPERSFTTRAEAAAGGAFEAGWLPDALVPASARNLRIRRDLDADLVWGRFEFDTADRSPLARQCQPVAQGSFRLPGNATRGIGWWPEMLRADEATAASQFTVFRCAAGQPGTPWLAIHRSLDTAFYWRTRP